jgi:aspartyl-tRNA(Asn)/glutamyl-tRNA(Gln) amidotransferase subunit B
MRSAEEAVAFVRQIHAIVTYLGVSDGEMSQGSLRCDANVSVRPLGQTELGTRAEIKNINSFRFIERAINIEVERQIELIEDGGAVVQETRLYDAERNETRPMRSKEVANDYRYFPCPDLLPVVLDHSFIEEQRALLPELPREKLERFVDAYGLSAYDASVLTQEKPVADYFEAVARSSGDAKLAANWVTVELAAQLNKNAIPIEKCPVSPDQIGKLITRIKDGTISGKIAKQVFETLWDSPQDPDLIIESQGLKQVSDSGAIEQMVDQVLADNPDQVASYLGAPQERRPKMLGFFVGQVMKLSKGQANPQEVNRILNEKLK